MQKEDFKNKGNDFFKSQNYSEALKYYIQAENLDKENPVYQGNKSAVYFSVGDYNTCLEILLQNEKNFSKLEEQQQYNYYNRIIKSCYLLGKIELIPNYFSKLKKLQNKNKEEDYLLKKIENHYSSFEKINFVIPFKYNSNLYLTNSVNESFLYYPVSNQVGYSLLSDITEKKSEKYELTIKDVLKSGDKEMNLLFCAMGDIRSLLNTVLDIAEIENKHKNENLKTLDFYNFYCNDINEKVLARNIIFFYIFNKEKVENNKKLALNIYTIWIR
jgi:tetratricopeptide (TPR) repeat protein